MECQPHYLTSSTSWDKFTFLCLSCLICKVGTGPANIFLLLAVILQKCSSIIFSHLALTHFYVSLHTYKKSFSIFHLSFLEETHALKEITVSKTQFLKLKKSPRHHLKLHLQPSHRNKGHTHSTRAFLLLRYLRKSAKFPAPRKAQRRKGVSQAVGCGPFKNTDFWGHLRRRSLIMSHVYDPLTSEGRCSTSLFSGHT